MRTRTIIEDIKFNDSVIVKKEQILNYVPEYLKPEKENRFIGLIKGQLIDDFEDNISLLVYPTKKINKKSPFMYLSKANYIISYLPDKRYMEATNVSFTPEEYHEILKAFIPAYKNVIKEIKTKEKEFLNHLVIDGKEIYINLASLYTQNEDISNLDYKFANTLKKNFKFTKKSSMQPVIKAFKNSTLQLQFFPELETFLVLFFLKDYKIFNFIGVELFTNIIRFLVYKYFRNSQIRKTYEFFQLDLEDYYRDKFKNIVEKLRFIAQNFEKNPMLIFDYVIYAYRYYISLRNTINSSIREYAQQFYKESQYMIDLNQMAFDDSEKYEKLDLVQDTNEMRNPEYKIEISELIEKIKEIAAKYGFDFDEIQILEDIVNKRKINNKNSKIKRFIAIVKEEFKEAKIL